MGKFIVLPLSPLPRISPSRYFALEQCALREIWSSNRVQALLPVHPAAHLGSVIHSIMQAAIQGQIIDEASFNRRWEQTIKDEEEKMLTNPIEKNLVPLESSIPIFEVKRIMTYNLVSKVIRTSVPLKKVECHTERWFESEDKSIGGFIDLLVKTENGIELVDYKSGVIEESPSSDLPKKEYLDQLKLYAAIVFEHEGIWPNKLTLIGINQKPTDISFNEQECIELFEKAKNKIIEINRLVSTSPDETLFSSPSPTTCKYCLYRPACKSYWEKKVEDSDWPLDFQGKIVEKRVLGNGTYNIKIDTGTKLLFIRGLSKDKFTFLDGELNYCVFCNLGKDTSENHFIEKLLTMGYGFNVKE